MSDGRNPGCGGRGGHRPPLQGHDRPPLEDQNEPPLEHGECGPSQRHTLDVVAALCERRRSPEDPQQIPERPQRLRRLDRLFTAHPVYFVTACTSNRRPLLANESIHKAFLAFGRNGLVRGVFVGRYVLMPDHLHLFVRFGQEYEQTLIDRTMRGLDDATGAARIETARTERRYSAVHGEAVAAVCDRRDSDRRNDYHVSPLSSWMKSLKNSLSKTLNATGQPAPHWQKGFFDHVMRSAESYGEKWQYMVANPVRACLTKAWQDWPWQGEIYALAF